MIARIIKNAPQYLQKDPSLKFDINPRFVIPAHGNKTLNTSSFNVRIFLAKSKGPYSVDTRATEISMRICKSWFNTFVYIHMMSLDDLNE